MALVTITGTELRAASSPEHRAWCEQLESGSILFFPQSPIPLDMADIEFLRGQQQADSSLHKNIAYKPASDTISGLDRESADSAAAARLRGRGDGVPLGLS
jgi:hypothetical protein